MKREKIVVLTGAGISAPSGLATFRDRDGIWSRYRIEDVATPAAWARQPEVVLEFYNARRAQAFWAQPNAGHRALVALETKFDVVIVTQNVDDLHERAGSSRVIHVHGELRTARSTIDPSLVYDLGGTAIKLGDRCAKGSQLRPHIVWFGEDVQCMEEAAAAVRSADRLLVVGTSLQVYPAAGLIDHAPPRCQKVLVDLVTEHVPEGFAALPGSAHEVLPGLVKEWLGLD